MDWMKILSKGRIYVIQTVIIVILVIALITCNISGSDGTSDSGTSAISEDIGDLRDGLDTIEESNLNAINVVNGVIDDSTLITDGLDQLSTEGGVATGITSEIAGDNRDNSSDTRELQDRTLESELVADGLERLIKKIEDYNNYN